MMRRTALIGSAIAAGMIAMAFVAGRLWISAQTAPYRYASESKVPARGVAIVFGAGLEPDGTPSGMLADRLDAAIALQRSGKVKMLLMSGDNSRVDYNEVAAMERYALEHGIGKDKIVLDHAGFNTYDTCYRARTIFGVRRAVLITQEFHLQRAIYTCRGVGIDAVGYGTGDWGIYSVPMMVQYSVRETIADAHTLMDVNWTHRLPRFLGPYIGMR